LYVFNIYDIGAMCYMSYDEVLKITNQLGLQLVPVVYMGPMKQEWVVIKELLKLAEKQKYQSGMLAEGLVMKTDYGAGHPRMSCKIISNVYLIKHGL